MEHGSLKLHIRQGRFVGASINAALDITYGEMYRSARTRLARDPEALEDAIAVIVFGCFWLEAVCNSHLRELMRTKITPAPVGDAVWEALQRVSIRQKLTILFAFGQQRAIDEEAEVGRQLAQLFDLRNRLTHFKDDDREVLLPHTLTRAEDFARPENLPDVERFFALDDPDLIRELKEPRRQMYLNAIDRIATEIEAVFSQFVTVDSLGSIPLKNDGRGE